MKNIIRKLYSIKVLHEIRFYLFGTIKHGHELILKTKKEIAILARKHPDSVLIEIGSERGCGSTIKLAKMAKELGLQFITVDIDKDIIKNAELIVKKINPRFEAYNKLGEEFLTEWSTANLGIVYLDAFDIEASWHKQKTIKSYHRRDVKISNDNAWEMHLLAAKAVFNKIVPGGYICFDDTWKENSEWLGKGKYGIPFLLNNGFYICQVIDPHCVLLQKDYRQ